MQLAPVRASECPLCAATYFASWQPPQVRSADTSSGRAAGRPSAASGARTGWIGFTACCAPETVLAKAGHDATARQLVEGLEARHRGASLRRVRRLALRTWPSLRTFWRFVRA